MGFFSFVKKAGKQLVSDVAGGLDLLSTAFQKPLVTASTLISSPKDIPKLVKETTSRPLKKQITSTLITTALASATILTAGKIGLPKTVPGIIKTAVIGTTITGAVVTSPKVAGILEPTANVERAFGAGEIIGKVAEGKDTGLTMGGALKTGGLIGAGVIGAVAIVKGTEKLIDILPSTPDTLKPGIIKEKPLGVEGETPILPETATITTGKKRYKRRQKKIIPSVKQSVRVNIVNSNTNKRYIRGSVLCS